MKNSSSYSLWTSGNYKVCYDEIKEKVSIPKKQRKTTVNRVEKPSSNIFNIEELSSKGIGFKCRDLNEEILLLTALKTLGVETKNSKSTSLSDSGAYIIKFNNLKNSYYVLYDYNFEGNSLEVKQYKSFLKKQAMKDKEFFYEKLGNRWVVIHYIIIFGGTIIFNIIKAILDNFNIKISIFDLVEKNGFFVIAIVFICSFIICSIISSLANKYREPSSAIHYLYDYDDDYDDPAIGAGF